MDSSIWIFMATALSFASNTLATIKPHIIMIMADDLGWNDVGFRGGRIKTPNIDALAESGVILNNYYTAPNCGPSRAQFLTGKYLTHLGLQHKNLQPCRPSGIPLSETTIADELGTLGYKSHLIGKWHGGFHTSQYLPTNRGFDTFRGMLNGMGDHYTHMKGFRGEPFLDFYNDTTPYPGANGTYSTDYYRDRALEVIDEHSKSKEPMFMFLSFQAPHTPNQAPQQLIDLYQDIADEGRRRYAAMIAGMDDAIGAVMLELLNKDMYDNTVVVFSTDNGGQAISGGASNYPLRGNKGTYYEGGIRGVAVLSSPLTRFVGASDALIHITDWKPTFVHLAGGKLVDHDGVNQWDTISNLRQDGSRTEIIYNIDPLTVGNRASRRNARRRSRGFPGRRKRPENKPFSFRERFENAVLPTSTPPRNTFATDLLEPHFAGVTDSTTTSSSTTTAPTASLFNLDQLAVIRSGDWKMLTGPVGFDEIIPNPDTNLLGYLNTRNQKNPNPSVRLYNITADPTESHDLSEQRPDIVRTLVQKLAAHEETAKPVFYPAQSSDCSPQRFGDVWAWGPYLQSF